MADDQVRFDVQINAKNAIQELREMSKEATSVAERVAKFSSFLVEKSRQWNVPVKELLNTFRQLNAEMAKQKTQTIFGNIGGQNIFNLSDRFLASAQAAGRFTTNANGVVKSIRDVSGGMDNMAKSTKNASGEIEILGNKLNIVRTAFGTLLAVGIFQFLQLLSESFKTLVHNIRETELAVYNLVNAERRLSEQGIDVTPQGLQEIIDSVRELVPILSQIQAEELVSRIATNVAPALKLTNEQIRQMAEATALLYIRNKALGKSFDEVESQLTNAFLTGKVSQGINNLGVKISDQIVRDEALRLGLVKTAEEFDELTGEMEAQIKASAMLSVVYQNATQDIQALDEYMQTADAQISRVNTGWNDLLTTLGTEFGPVIAQVMEMVAHAIEVVIVLLERAKQPLADFVATFVALADTFRGKNFLSPGGMFALLTSKSFWEEYAINLNKTKESMKGLAEAADTPTAAVEGLGDAIKNLDADKFKQKVEDILTDAAQAREDLNKKLGEKRADIDEEYRRKALDAEKDYGRKVADINRDYERDLAKIKEKQREDDLKAEENYQLKLWELRMRFLMDLEDALHARDARQVIRLQKQYEIDKEALARKQNLDEKQQKDDQKAELEDAALKRDQKLADAKLEYEQKLADQRVAKQRELEDLNVWYKREQADLETNIRRKLEALIKGWIDEKKITEQNAYQVYAILYKYFGPGGMTDQLYAYMQTKLGTPIAFNVAPVGSLNYGLGLPQGANAFTGGTSTTTSAPALTKLNNKNSPYWMSEKMMAEGGTFIATRPTKVTFGEAGPEMATFTPLGRLGRNQNTVFSNGGVGLNGQIVVQLDLSPDLEARVVENSMNGVAEIVTKVNRSKL